MEPVIVSNSGPDRPLPPAGICSAVCCYALDIGIHDTPYGEKQQVMLGFELEHRFEEGDYKGERFLITPMPFTATLNKKGNLAECLVGWLGRDLTTEENKSLDLSSLVGQMVTVTIQHKEVVSGKVYANIVAYAPPMPNADKMVVELKATPDWVKEKRVAGTNGGMLPDARATSAPEAPIDPLEGAPF